jgi:uncharacterized membrane protein
VRSALYRAAALLLFLLVHKLLNVILEWTVPKGFKDGVPLLETIAFAGFAVIYVALVVEMVVVFIPSLRRKMYPQEQGQRPEKREEVEIYANRDLRNRDEAED